MYKVKNRLNGKSCSQSSVSALKYWDIIPKLLAVVVRSLFAAVANDENERLFTLFAYVIITVTGYESGAQEC